jgi:urease accessory protein
MNRNLRFRLNRLVIGILVNLLIPGAAIAHHAEWMKNKPFIHGLSMPVHGLDHMLVTFAVGLIAVQVGGSALWAVPIIFSMLLLLEGVMNVSGIGVPFVEHAIFASLILLGGLLTYRKQLPLLLGWPWSPSLQYSMVLRWLQNARTTPSSWYLRPIA